MRTQKSTPQGHIFNQVSCLAPRIGVPGCKRNRYGYRQTPVPDSGRQSLGQPGGGTWGRPRPVWTAFGHTSAAYLDTNTCANKSWNADSY